MKAAFYTLGCKVNQYDTQAMRELFERAGHEVVEFEQAADVSVSVSMERFGTALTSLISLYDIV